MMAESAPAAADRLTRNWSRFGTVLAGLVYVFLLVPSLLVVPISFGPADHIAFPTHGLSLALYRQFFASPSWTRPLIESLELASLSTILVLVMAIPASYAMVRRAFFGKGFIVVVLMSPAAVPVIVLALGLYLYMSILGLTGTLGGLVVSHAVYVAPFVIVTIAAGVRKLDEQLEFAATLMGATRLQVLGRVVLPQLVPSIVAGALFAFIMSFDEVVIAWFLTSASTTTLPVKMYSAIQWEVSPVIAAVSTILTALSFTACVAAAILQRPSDSLRRA